MQARAPGLATKAFDFNPSCSKPGSDRTSQLVVSGQVATPERKGTTHRQGTGWRCRGGRLALSLRSEFDAVICEGAGSPAEIKLRATDLANMGAEARAADLPVLLVGGHRPRRAVAHLTGQSRFCTRRPRLVGIVATSPRPTPRCSACLDQLQKPQRARTQPYGVIPHTDGRWLDTEDSVVRCSRTASSVNRSHARSDGCGWPRFRCRASPTPRCRGPGMRARRGWVAVG